MTLRPGNSLNKATCVRVSVYAEALTYGQTYEILAWDEGKNQVKVQGDNGRARWYPCGCFDMTGKEVSKCVQIHLDDHDFTAIVEVSLQFSDGQLRWCFFTTPEMLSQLGGEQTFGMERLLSYGAAHMIVVSAISQEIIEQAINYIESQGELLTSTKPIE